MTITVDVPEAQEPRRPVPTDVPEHCREWRVVWRREGAHWQQRILQSDSAMRVLVVELRTADLHGRCDEAHRDCLGALVRGPIVRWRATSEWMDE